MGRWALFPGEGRGLAWSRTTGSADVVFLAAAFGLGCPGGGQRPAGDVGDDDASEASGSCEALPRDVVAPCPAADAPLDVAMQGEWLSWGAPLAQFQAVDGSVVDIEIRQDGEGFSGLPALGTLGPQWLWLSGQCEGNKDGTVLAASPTMDFRRPYLVLSNREVTDLGPLHIESPRDTSGCPAVDRGGCWPAEHNKGVRISDGSDAWTVYQGPAADYGPWRVEVMVAFSGAGESRCPDCCSSERLAYWMASRE